MPQIKLEGTDVEDFTDVLVDFLTEHKITSVKVHHFSLEADSEFSEEVKVENLRSKLLDLFRESDLIPSWGVKITELSCQFDYDGDDFYLTHPENIEMNKFKKLS